MAGAGLQHCLDRQRHLIAPTIPTWLCLAREHFEIRSANKLLDTFANNIRLAGVLAPFIDNKPTHVLALACRLATGSEQALRIENFIRID